MRVIKFLLVVLSVIFGLPSDSYSGDVYVNGYYRKDGTYVRPHYRSAPNHTVNDNFSTEGNINPYTGEPGTKPREPYNNDYQYRSNQEVNNIFNDPEYEPFGYLMIN